MIIKPSIRSNVFLNAHPKGIKKYIESLITEAKSLPQFEGPKNVLIIGGSSGYGLASRVALALGANSSTINVSFEAEPQVNKTGTAGFWNNVYFQEFMQSKNQTHVDFIGDAYSQETKDNIIHYLKENNIQLDLVIYSLAAGARPNPQTGDLVRSALKPIGEDLIGYTIDVQTKQMKEISITKATEEEIKNTVFVMGGSDWESWLENLHQANVLNQSVKTISYTYVGSGSMDKIYRSGTIGKAKDDLEATALRMDEWIQLIYGGEALISSSKAVVTKASVFIPGITTYIACLFDVMKEHHTHESTLKHKHRLFETMVYGNSRKTDALGRIRIDHFEMEENVQEKTLLCTESAHEQVLSMPGTQSFIEEFYHIHGFEYDDVNYEEDIDVLSLVSKAFKRI
jgi:enoyl-[acyl-carrier protein] reductase / trans-2-enoyl-CoA reductase (NAD+)